MTINAKSKLTIIIIASILYVICPANTMAAEKDWTLSVQGIKIAGNGYKNTSENIMPFNQFKGTAVACLLIIKSGGIISFVVVKSSINEFKDNLGTNLIDPGAMHGNGFGFMPELSKDRSALMFDITGSNLPDKRATSMSASGMLAINLASKTDRVTIKDINFSIGTIIETPVASLKIIGLKENSWGEHPYKVLFESSANLSVIKKIQFKHLNGQPIESKRSGGGSHNIVGDLSTLKFEKEYSISEKPKSINMIIDFWADMKTNNIPFSFTTSIGL